VRENVVKEKSYAFALRIVNLYKWLCSERKEFVLSKQILKSGTSVGANIEEACAGQSKKDFISKINISYKEIKETHFWLRLLKDSEYIDQQQFDSLIIDCEELIKLLVSILKTSRENL
jgi:four helix bundle protein